MEIHNITSHRGVKKKQAIGIFFTTAGISILKQCDLFSSLYLAGVGTENFPSAIESISSM